MDRNDTPPGARIAHVLFIDIVGYSREKIAVQGQMLRGLNAAVAASDTYSRAKESEGVCAVPSGDGMALLFFTDVAAPARCAVEITRNLAGSAPLPVRMGIHSGLVQRQIDIAGNENFVGEGINTANRVMDFGDAGHILLSAQYATWLQQFEEWAACLKPIGEGTAKHDLKLVIYSLQSDTFGSASTPGKLSPKAKRPANPPGSKSAQPHKVALLYKRNLEPDESVLHIIEEQLASQGYEVIVDRHQKIDAEWALAIGERIRAMDAVIAIVSPKSMQSEMLEYELEAARDQHGKTGKPVILPVTIGLPEEIEGPIAAIIQPLNRFRWSGPEDDRRLVAELLSAIHEPLKPRMEEVHLEPVGGAVPPGSPFYVRRACDQEFMNALTARETIILLKGARQIGKTSMQAQGVRLAREMGWRYALTDFQKLNSSQLVSEETFYRLIAATLSRQLKFKYDFQNEWDDLFGANLNLENFLRELIGAADEPFVWFMDEVDKLFLAPFASDFFGLVRSWHNSRSTEPGGPWDNLTVVIGYATEAHLFIQDLNQSPFNVGRRLDLEDFNLEQVVDLNGRYGGPLKSYAEVEALQALVGGHPFLTRCALDAIATGRMDFAGLQEQADRDDGPFGDHLKRVLVAVTQLPAVVEAARAVLTGNGRLDTNALYRLIAAGIVRQDSHSLPAMRCGLYQRYLKRHLLQP